MRKPKPQIIRNITNLVDIHEDRTWINVDVEIVPEGDLFLRGQDIGNAPEGFFGSSEYEYTLIIKSGNKKGMLTVLKEKYEPGTELLPANEELPETEVVDHELIAMLQKYYTNHPKIISNLEDLLKEGGIPCEFSSYY
jgi:hypothetical protein